MLRKVLIIFEAISIISASPLKDEKDEMLKPQFNGFEMASREEINRVDAEEGIESNLIFDGIVVKRRKNRHLGRRDDGATDRSEEVLEDMPYFSNLSNAFESDRMVNPDGAGRYTWQTYIKFYHNSSMKHYSACSGIAICPRAVVTAGHCVEGRPVDLIRVHMSPGNICPMDVKPVLASEIASLFTLYDGGVTSAHAHNIAIIKLVSGITSFFNVISNIPPPPYKKSRGLGYGITGAGSTPEAACRSYYSDFGPSGCSGWKNPGQWICVKPKTLNGGICNGDSGGPLVVPDPNHPDNPNIPVGVAAFYYGPKHGSCFSQEGSVYSSIYHYTALFQSTLRNLFQVCY